METALFHLRKQGKLEQLEKQLKDVYVERLHSKLINEFERFLEKINLPNEWYLKPDVFCFPDGLEENDYLYIYFGKGNRLPLVSARIELHVNWDEYEFRLHDCVASFSYADLKLTLCHPEDIEKILRNYDDFDGILEKVFS